SGSRVGAPSAARAIPEICTSPCASAMVDEGIRAYRLVSRATLSSTPPRISPPKPANISNVDIGRILACPPTLIQWLDVEPEVHHIAFLDDVFLALEAQLAGVAGTRLALEPEIVVVRDDLGADEPALEVGMDDARGLRRGSPDAHRPGAYFLLPGREIGLQA